ncbi:Cilia- and flagella-associated protein [Schistosoma japonicum]|nr:Cilia- and flagella-associated protein [Schistosoma japonicum]
MSTSMRTTTNQTSVSSTISLKDEYQLLGSVYVPKDLTMNVNSELNFGQIITQLQISPSDEFLIASTNTHQLYQFNLNNIDTNMKGGELVTRNSYINNSVKEQRLLSEKAIFVPVSQSFHNGQILGMDVCIRKPLIATCATDRTVRIWNFETNDLDLNKQFAEEVFSVALHPTGLFILVGFSDKLRFMNILIDDLRVFHEFTIRGCRECAFSNGGHLIAAVNGNVIQIYSTTTFDNLLNLKGHNGKIRSIIWSDDDHKLISCGMDGAVYEWDTHNGTRINENVLKSCSYTSVSVSQDGKVVYAVGSDKTLREISDSQIVHEIQSPDNLLTTVTISRSGRMLFCGCQNGQIRSYQMPLTDHSDCQDYVGHCQSVTKMKMASFDEYLVTVSMDCSLMIWRIQDREARSTKTDKEVGWMEEILITKSDLEEKNSIMTELKTRVEELKIENEYQLRLKDMNYNERIKELTEKFIQEMETLKTKNQLLKTEKERNEIHYQNQLTELNEQHNQQLQNIESLSNQKLINEYDKYNELQNLTQSKEVEYEKQLHNMEVTNERLLNETIECYETKINDKLQIIDNLTNELKEQTNEYELSRRLIEEDADREILEIKIKYEKRLHIEHDLNTQLKSESSIMKKKFASLQKEIDEYKDEIKKVNVDIQKSNSTIRNLEKDIQSLRKELQERDETIQDKEKRISDLKKKNQELEKFKYVLDYKIKELKKQIEPRENDIKNYKEQIQEMEVELQRFNKQNDQLEINISELKQKYKSIENELKFERQSTRDIESLVRRLKTDLFNCVGFIQEPKQLKASILALYKKHIHEDMNIHLPFAVDATADADIQKEFSRQREHLERSVIGLRQKLARDSEMHRSDYVRIMQENVTLIQEIDNLRTELKLSRNHINDLEAALGLNRKDGDKARQLLIQINKQRQNPILESDYEHAQRTLLAQQELINALQIKLDGYIQGYNSNTNDLLKELQTAAHSTQHIKSSSSTTTPGTTVLQSRPYTSSNILPPIGNGSITESLDQ